MSWAIGYDGRTNRHIGYGVPAICDHPGCGEKIDRGLAYVCGGEPYGGEHGCGLFFCPEHLRYAGRRNPGKIVYPQLCERCEKRRKPFEPTPDVQEWIAWKMTDASWAAWRAENPDFVAKHSAMTV